MVQRKSVSGHTVIAEATKATGAIMAAQMQEIADSSRDLERSKIDVQLKLFTEQMSYQREKDRKMYENAAIANENARLAILKQGEMVSCLSQLSHVLSTGLQMSSAFPQVVTTPGGQDHAGTSSAHHLYGGHQNAHVYGLRNYPGMPWAPPGPMDAPASTTGASRASEDPSLPETTTEGKHLAETTMAANEGDHTTPTE